MAANSEDILEINATNEDLFCEESSSSVNLRDTREVKSNNKWVMLKLMPAPSALINAIDLIEFFVNKKNLIVKGMFLKSNRSVLIEVLFDRSLENYLIMLIEERQNGTVLNQDARKNVLLLADGKFKIRINNSIVFIFVYSEISSVCSPKISNSSTSRETIYENTNVSVGDFSWTHQSQILLHVIYSLRSIDMFENVIGIRIEQKSCSKSFLARLLMPDSILSNYMIDELKRKFDKVEILSSVIFIVPSTVVKFIDRGLMRDISKLLIDYDLITCKSRECTLFYLSKSLNNQTIMTANDIQSSQDTGEMIRDTKESSKKRKHESSKTEDVRTITNDRQGIKIKLKSVITRPPAYK